MSVLLGSEVSELAWERAKLPTCFGGLGIRVAQTGFAAQATYWSAVVLHKAVMTNICEALSRPIREPHPGIAAALAAKTDLLLSGFAVDEHARVTIENEASKLDRFAPAPVQTADRVSPKSLVRDMAFAKLQSRILSVAEALQSAKLHSEILSEQQAITLSAGGLALASAGRPCTSHRQNCHMEDGHGVTAWCYAGRWPVIYVCSEEGQRWGHVRAVSGDASVPLFLLQEWESQKQAAPRSPVYSAQAHRAGRTSSRQEAMRTWSAMSLSSMNGSEITTRRHPRCGAQS